MEEATTSVSIVTSHSDESVASGSKPNLYHCTLYYFLVGTCLGGVILVVGFFGNGCTLLVMRKDRKKSSTINCLFLLAVADTMVLVVQAFYIIPLGFRKYVFGWYNGYNYNHMANMYASEILYIFNQLSGLLVILVTFQRYVGICWPHRAKQLCTVKRVNQLAAASFIASVLFYCPRFFTRKVVTGSDGRFTFYAYPIIASPVYSIFYSTVLTALVSFLIPLVALTFMSVKILVAMKTRVQPDTQQAKQTTTQVRKDLTVSSIIIVVIFIVCQSFVFVRKVLEWNYHPLGKYMKCGGVLQYFYMTPFIAMMVNSSANFFVYVIFTRGFRRKLMKLRSAQTTADVDESKTRDTEGRTESKM